MIIHSEPTKWGVFVRTGVLAHLPICQLSSGTQMNQTVPSIIRFVSFLCILFALVPKCLTQTLGTNLSSAKKSCKNQQYSREDFQAPKPVCNNCKPLNLFWTRDLQEHSSNPPVPVTLPQLSVQSVQLAFAFSINLLYPCVSAETPFLTFNVAAKLAMCSFRVLSDSL